MSDFDDRIKAALNQEPRDATHAIKAAVADELTAADPAIRIEQTQYFNHSYLPDLIGSWSAGDKREARPYYLRLNLGREDLAADVARLGNDSPAIVGLLPTQDDEIKRTQLVETSPTTLVADGSALSLLSAGTADDGFASLVPPALVRGGRGYLNEAGARELAAAAGIAFSAAADLNLDATRSTLATLHRHLSDQQAVGLERTLGVVWLGSGGEPDAFPSSVDLDSSPLPGRLRETLSLLLNQPPIETEGFWKRIASWISEADLLSLGELPPSANLQLLMAEASTVLKFVSVALTDSDTTTSDTPVWAVANGGLLFSAGEMSLHFVTDGRAHSHWPEVHDLPEWSELSDRLPGLSIDRVQFDSGSVTVRVDASGKKAKQEDVLARIQSMQGLGRVRELVVRATDGSNVRCRLACRVATGERSAKVRAAELGWIALSVVAGLDPSLHPALRTTLYGVEAMSPESDSDSE